MNKKIIFFFAFILLCQLSNCQSFNRKIAVGLSLGKTLYVGDYGGNGFFDFNHTDAALPQGFLSSGFYINSYLSPSFDLGIQGNYSDYGYWFSEEYNFIAVKSEASVFAHFKLNNGFILREKSKLSPFLSLGLGVAVYSQNKQKDKGVYPRGDFNGLDFIVPLGLGLKYQISREFAIQYQYLYNMINSDNHDTHMGGTSGQPNYDFEHQKPGNDAWGEHVFSVIYSISTIRFNKKNPWKPRYEYDENNINSQGYKDEDNNTWSPKGD
jgi:OmpA-OmpF porin, OOP family